MIVTLFISLAGALLIWNAANREPGELSSLQLRLAGVFGLLLQLPLGIGVCVVLVKGQSSGFLDTALLLALLLLPLVQTWLGLRLFFRSAARRPERR
ncbi:MAG: hypothetical protein V3573_05080 [Desulfovibrionaceae bacterium]